jgi:hypothetical protein
MWLVQFVLWALTHTDSVVEGIMALARDVRPPTSRRQPPPTWGWPSGETAAALGERFCWQVASLNMHIAAFTRRLFCTYAHRSA